MSKFSTQTAGICGLFCGTCPKFSETCDGCLSDRVDAACRDCRHGFRTCAVKNKVTWCFECGNFPCSRLEAFIPVHVENGIVHHKNIIQDLQAMRDIGVQKWVDRQTEDNTCPHCGRIIQWQEGTCPQCGAKG